MEKRSRIRPEKVFLQLVNRTCACFLVYFEISLDSQILNVQMNESMAVFIYTTTNWQG